MYLCLRCRLSTASRASAPFPARLEHPTRQTVFKHSIRSHPVPSVRVIHIRLTPARLNTGRPGRTLGTKRPFLPLFRLVVRELVMAWRNMFAMWRIQNLKTLWKKQPVSMAVAAVVFVVSIFIVAYTVWFVVGFAYNRAFTKYPEPVAFSLRKAIFYTLFQRDDKLALKYWTEALDQAVELGMDVMSDDVMGIRISTAGWFEKIGDFENALKILNATRVDVSDWIDKFELMMERGDVKDGVVRKQILVKNQAGQVVESRTVHPADTAHTGEEAENPWARRRRLAELRVKVSIKMAQIYALQHVQMPEKATEELEFAVENMLAEMRRRKEEGVKPHEGDFLDPDQVGATFEELAMDFEKNARPELALPLLLQALPLSKEPCQSATIMNNMATCFFHYPYYLPDDTIVAEAVRSQVDLDGKAAPEPKQAMLVAARNWARNSIDLSTNTIKKEYFMAEERKTKCAVCAMAATVNLAEIFERLGKVNRAGDLFRNVLDEKGPGGLAMVWDTAREDAKEARRRAYEGLERVKAAKEVKGREAEKMRLEKSPLTPS